MRAFETIVIHLDKFITFADNLLAWFFTKYEGVHAAMLKTFEIAKAVYEWWLKTFQAMLAYANNIVDIIKQTWQQSQEVREQNHS